MRALFNMCCVLSLVIAHTAAASNDNPYAVTNWDRSACENRFGNQIWDDRLQACVCNNRLYEPRADACLSERTWLDYQAEFGKTDPVEVATGRLIAAEHPQPYHADADGDGYSDEWDEDDTNPDVNPAIPVSLVSHPSEGGVGGGSDKPRTSTAPGPTRENNLRDASVSQEELDESDPAPTPEEEAEASEDVGEEVSLVDLRAVADEIAETERREREEERERVEQEARRETEELAQAKADQEAREAERRAELERREREAATAAEAERAAEASSILAARADDLELDPDEDYFADEDEDMTFDPSDGLELIGSEEVDEKLAIDEGIEYEYGYRFSGSDSDADASIDIDSDKDGDGISNLNDFCQDDPGIPSDDPSLNGCPEHMHPDEDADAEAVNFEDLPEVDEDPPESPAERQARLKTERDERREQQRLEREALKEERRLEREAAKARRERERKLDDQADWLSSLVWEKGCLSYKKYRGDETLDTDRDGLPDDMDLCPEDPEDFDNFIDASGYLMPLDGCPDPENGFIKLHWDPENQRFDDIRPGFSERWDMLEGDFWFEDDDSYTEEALELLRELALVLEAYDLKVEVKGRSLHGENPEEKLEYRHLVGRWAKALAAELESQCVEAGYADCPGRIYSSSATGYSGIKHNTIILAIMTH